MATDADVLIVGAGPAGATAGLVLARAGVRVRLVDRARFPRPKLCGDTLNPGALAVLAGLGLSEEVLAAAVRLEGMTVTGPGGATVTGLYGVPPSRLPEGGSTGAGQIAGAALPRSAFDWLLLRRAVAAGAVLEEDVNVLGAVVENPAGRGVARVAGVAALGPGGRRVELRAPITIAADGRRSRIAFGLGLARHPARPRRWAIGTYFEGVAGVGRVGEMHVRPGHYVGIAPLPGGLANVCLVVPEETARKAGPSTRMRPSASLGAGGWGAALLDEAISGDPLLRDRFCGARALSPPTILGPLAVDATGRDVPGLLVAGDAGGFIDPMTGDGMRFALRGGELAAAEAIRLLRDGPGAPGQFARLLDLEFGRKRAFNRALRRLVGWGGTVRVAALAGSLRPGLVACAVRYAGDVGRARGVSRSTTPRAAAPAAGRETPREPGGEARHVRPERDAPLRPGRRGDRPDAAEHLEEEPEAEEADRRDLDDLDEDEDRHQREHARPREEDEVGAQHARDGAARADRRDVASRGSTRHLREAGHRAAQEVEDQVAAVPHPVLDVVAEDPEVPHVPEEVQPAAVQEHRRTRRSRGWKLAGTIPHS